MYPTLSYGFIQQMHFIANIIYLLRDQRIDRKGPILSLNSLMVQISYMKHTHIIKVIYMFTEAVWRYFVVKSNAYGLQPFGVLYFTGYNN